MRPSSFGDTCALVTVQVSQEAVDHALRAGVVLEGLAHDLAGQGRGQRADLALELRGGLLTLFHIPAPGNSDRPALCGEIQSKAYLQHGTYEARIRTPRQSGLNASVFTYAGPVHDSPHDEIDIEILTRDPGVMTMNTYVSGQPHNGGTTPSDTAFDEDFRTVGFRWVPEGITWFLDGREVHRTEPDSILPTHPQKLYMSFWSTATLTDWMGHQEPQDGPLAYEIDWVAFTPLDEIGRAHV